MLRWFGTERPEQLDATQEASLQPAGDAASLDTGVREPIPGPGRTLRIVRPAPPAPGDPDAARWLNLQTLELLAFPFRSFRDVGTFHETVANLPSVRSVQPRHLQDGALQIRVECASSRDLLTGLSEAYHLPFSVVHRETHRIEIALEHEASSNVSDLARRGA